PHTSFSRDWSSDVCSSDLPRGSEQTYATSSPSMDISRASNFERFVFDLLGRDGSKVKALWEQLAKEGQFDLSEYLPRFQEEFGFVAGASSHQDRLKIGRAS